MSVRRRRIALGWSVLALAWVATRAHAAQVLGVQVARDGARFVVSMHIAIDAPPPAVFRALQDYPAMPRYNPDLRTVRVQPTAVPDRVRLFTTIHICVLIFCKTLRQQQIMTAMASADGGVLDAVLVAHGSDFKEGYGRWTVSACPAAPSGSCLDARIEWVPTFWVPPVIGPWVIRSKMIEEAHRTSAGLERTARGR